MLTRVAVVVGLAASSAMGQCGLAPSATGSGMGIVWRLARSGDTVWAIADQQRIEGIEILDPAAPVRTATVLGDLGLRNLAAVAAGDGLLLALSEGPSATSRVWTVDVNDPRAPRVLGSVPLPGFISNGARMAVRGRLAAAAGNSDDTYLIDLTDPAAPTVVSRVAYRLNGLAFDGDTLFAALSSMMLVYDVSSPASPVLIRSQPIPGALDLAARNGVLAVSNGQGLTLWNIADPRAGMPLIRTITMPDFRCGELDWSGSNLAYTGPGVVDVEEPERAYVRFPRDRNGAAPSLTAGVAAFPGFIASAQGPTGVVIYPLSSGGPPVLRSELPARVTACRLGPFDLTVDVASETRPLNYQWYYANQPVPGATGPTLHLDRFDPFRNSGPYRCVITNACGELRAPLANGGSVFVSSCAADYTCDGMVDWADYDGFVGAFEAGSDMADSNADGFLDFIDYGLFVASFEHGC